MSNRPEVVKYYSTMQIRTANNPHIVCLLHDRCVKLLKKAKEKIDERTELIYKAQNILAQLERTLKTEDSVGQGLFLIYDYCYVRLENIDSQGIDVSLVIMSELSETFNQLLTSKK